MTAACPVPRANSRAASKRRASNAATSRRPCRVLAMPQHGIVPDEDHQSISRESLAAQYRLPAAYELKEYVEAGGLLSYGPNTADMYRRSASYVDRILKGAKPGDLPIERATTFELAINVKTARALGLAVPQSLLVRADYLVE